jgi:hypothetical protein
MAELSTLQLVAVFVTVHTIQRTVHVYTNLPVGKVVILIPVAKPVSVMQVISRMAASA